MGDRKIKNILVLSHGIKTHTRYNWMRIFTTHLKYDERFDGWVVKKANYGYLWAIMSVFPFVRRSRIKWFMRVLRKLQKEYPEAQINILAHSYGTMLAYEAIRRSGVDDNKEPIKINKLILIAGIVSSHERFIDTIDIVKIKRVYNYCSYDDKVARYNPFGHIYMFSLARL